MAQALLALAVLLLVIHLSGGCRLTLYPVQPMIEVVQSPGAFVFRDNTFEGEPPAIFIMEGE